MAGCNTCWLYYKHTLAYIHSVFFFLFFFAFCFISVSSQNIPSLIYLLFAAFFIGTESKMKLWDVLATCLLLLSSVATRPLYQNTLPAKRTYFPSSYSDSVSLSVEDEERAYQREDHNLQEISMENQCKLHSMSTKSYCGMKSLWSSECKVTGLHGGSSYRSVPFVQTYMQLPIHM